MVALQAPDLVRRMVLAGTGPRGGGGIWKMPFIVGGAYAKAFLTRKDPRHFLFFPRTTEGKKAANAYFARLAERTAGSRQADLLAGRASPSCARSPPPACTPADDLSGIKIPVFVANGDNDLMVASEHSADMAARLPTPGCASTPTRATAACSSTTRSSCPRSLTSWPADLA